MNRNNIGWGLEECISEGGSEWLILQVSLLLLLSSSLLSLSLLFLFLFIRPYWNLTVCASSNVRIDSIKGKKSKLYEICWTIKWPLERRKYFYKYRLLKFSTFLSRNCFSFTTPHLIAETAVHGDGDDNLSLCCCPSKPVVEKHHKVVGHWQIMVLLSWS